MRQPCPICAWLFAACEAPPVRHPHHLVEILAQAPCFYLRSQHRLKLYQYPHSTCACAVATASTLYLTSGVDRVKITRHQTDDRRKATATVNADTKMRGFFPDYLMRRDVSRVSALHQKLWFVIVLSAIKRTIFSASCCGQRQEILVARHTKTPSLRCYHWKNQCQLDSHRWRQSCPVFSLHLSRAYSATHCVSAAKPTVNGFSANAAVLAIISRDFSGS